MSKRFNFLGVSVSVINQAEAFEIISSGKFPTPGYVCFPDAYVVKEASTDPLLTTILNSSFLTMPDGKPSQLAGRLQGHKTVTTVSGFHLCNQLLQTNLSHYFYGGDDQTLVSLKANIEARYPGAKVLGYKSPPFVSKESIRDSVSIKEDIDAIKQLKPDLVWIGISSPKQDYLIHYFHKSLENSLMLGVGGVFLYFSNESLKSPEWVKKMGLRWAYRLLKEPSRLGPKYYGTFKFLLSNAGFFARSFIKKKQTG